MAILSINHESIALLFVQKKTPITYHPTHERTLPPPDQGNIIISYPFLFFFSILFFIWLHLHQCFFSCYKVLQYVFTFYRSMYKHKISCILNLKVNFCSNIFGCQKHTSEAILWAWWWKGEILSVFMSSPTKKDEFALAGYCLYVYK